MATLRDVTAKPHSYRNHTPATIVAIANNDDLGAIERLEQAETALQFIEAGRLAAFASDTYEFFFKLDRDEQELFTNRNPDLVQWMSAWAASQEATNAFPEFREIAADALGPDRQEARDPPPFERSLRRDTLFKDMLTRRRSYRNWTPQEFRDIMADPEITLSRGDARELGWQSPDIREDVSFPVDVDSKEVARELFERVEDGRFMPVLHSGMTFFSKLDVDERRMFAARNPGIIMWISAWGRANHLLHADDLKVPFPTLREA